MKLSEIYQAELDRINELIDIIKKNGKEFHPKYICYIILEMTRNPYGFLCWHCSRQKNYRVGVRCSWARFGAKVGNKYSPIFGMTGLEILEKVKEEIECEVEQHG